ncbi:hypothetical protein BZA70DRAFT_282584 [Myxozyma melibiosi]|uniref:Dolichyl-diphosphooligosaccharide-protein glycosyltransferase subunit OST5 n=1 Tax=Myxozyma melibiosi TaxID=54550 RepID=A0ABR1F0U3_9ASCO
MSSILPASKLWSQGTPFTPLISIDSQPILAILLLLAGIVLTALFSMTDKRGISGFIKQSVVAIPASLTLGFGFVYLLCAVGVYV